MDADRIVELPFVKNLTAALHTIRRCEGTDTDEGYRALFGYHPVTNPTRLFDSYDAHPNILSPFRQTDGTTNYTTAAGAYQTLFRTAWRLKVKLKLGLDGGPWFTPTCQDMMAMELISECGAMAFAKNGEILKMLDVCSGVWASLPNSRYKQPKRSVAFALAAYLENGGTLA